MLLAYDNEDTRQILNYLLNGGICTLKQLTRLFVVFVSDDMKYKDNGFKHHMRKEYEDIKEISLRFEKEDKSLQELQEYIQDCLLKCTLRYRKKI